jgi:nucleoside-diphosphate-sugar epimerase
MAASGLTVAVTGPTGDLGIAIVNALERSRAVKRIVGMARRPFDPGEQGWKKTEYRQGDVTDTDSVRGLVKGADVVVHLAFAILEASDATRELNVDASRLVFEESVKGGVERICYASSVAAYGFHDDNPERIDETWPTRPAAKLFYAQEKAEVEELLDAEAGKHPELALFLLRPPVVLGPNVVGRKDVLPGPLAPLGRALFGRPRRLPVPVPVLVPAFPMQFIHEEDVGRALVQCIVAAGPPGAYNIAGDGVVTAIDVAREFGALPIPLPAGPAQAAARAFSRLPFLPPVAEWVEAASRPAIMDTAKAREQLGWRPRYSGLEALRDTLRTDSDTT